MLSKLTRPVQAVTKLTGKHLLQFETRGMKLHEYQSATLMHRYRIPIPLGNVAFNQKEAYVIARKFGGDYDKPYIVKAQIQAALRSQGYFKENGFAGGIHECSGIEQVRDTAVQMCGRRLVVPKRT